MLKKHLPITIQDFVLLAVGLFFLFSGLIKLNDPVGFAWKIEAYLRAFAEDIHNSFLYFIPYTLPIAISVCMVEVMLGAALVCKFNTRPVLLSLMGLTVFFTLLTGYTVWFKHIDSCGCLGEAIPLTPLQSFFKNILLLFLLSWLLRRERLSSSIFSLTNISLFILTTLCSLCLGLYVWQHLPIIDFGRYRIGTYIPQLTAPQQPLQYRYWLKKDGKTTINDNYSLDGTSLLIQTELLNPSDGPLVTNFTIWSEGREITQELLEGNKLICIVKQPYRLTTEAYLMVQAYARQRKQPLDILVLLPFHETKESLPAEARSQVGWGSADLLRSMIRSEVGFMLLQDGTVKGKWADTSLSSLPKTLMQLR